MSRNFHGIEKGLDIYQENGPLLVRFLAGTAAPDGLGDQSDAPIGSVYFRSGTGQIYQKITNAGNSSDWQLNGATSIGKWRNEKIVSVTNEAVANGVRDLTANPFTDDNAPFLTAADFQIGDHIISDADGTPVLRKVTAVASPNVTFANADSPLAAEDTFVVLNYLPDPAGQENRAIVVYNGSIVIKLADIDWSIATGINLSNAYVAATGNVAANDTVEAAIAKLDGVNDNQDTLLGRPQGSTDLGAWTAPVTLFFSATSTIKALFQRIGDLLSQLRGVQVANITAATTVDSVPHATVKAVKWFVEAFEEATPANRKSFEVFALTNGTLVDDTINAKLDVGANFNITTDVDISGADMRLRCTSSTAGVTVTARRIEVVKTTL